MNCGYVECWGVCERDRERGRDRERERERERESVVIESTSYDNSADVWSDGVKKRERDREREREREEECWSVCE